MKEIIVKLSVELGLPKDVIWKTYRAYWRYIKTTIESLPLKEDLNEESFRKLKTNFNIPNLGKLACTYEKYRYIKDFNKRRNVEHKESQTDC